jgi:hypothetical protein
MICYRDTTFCRDYEHCENSANCPRVLTAEDREYLDRVDMPVAWASFKDICEDYVGYKYFVEGVTK